jgi:hypothetical protein
MKALQHEADPVPKLLTECKTYRTLKRLAETIHSSFDAEVPLRIYFQVSRHDNLYLGEREIQCYGNRKVIQP